MPRLRLPAIATLIVGLVALAPSRAGAAEEPAAHAPGTAAAAVHGEPHAEPNILEFKPSLAITTLLVFLGLLLVLGKYAWGPLAKALDERERFQEETVAKAEQARADSERILAEHRALMAQANDQVRSIMDEARKTADATAQSIVAKAQTEAEAAKERAERDILQARDQALAELWTRSADLAVSVAGKVLSRELGPDEQERLVESAIRELPEAARSDNGRGGRA
jgi:F-type H+-transporting ATPase subunit b